MLPTNRYIIFNEEGEILVDDIIKYENLSEEISRVSRIVGVNFLDSMIGNYKSGIRALNLDYREYYDKESAQIVSDRFSHYKNHFGYDLTWTP